MPRSFPNPYAYESPIGQGLQNIAQMLLRDDGGAKAAMNAAHMQAYRAHADKLRADAEQTAQSTQSARDYEQALARNILGANGGQGLSFLRGDKQTLPAYEDPDKQMTMAPREVPVAAPDNMTPEVQTLMRRALIAGPAIRAGGGNAAQIVDALNKIGHQQSYDDVLSGKGDPGRYYVANGGAPYKFDDSYVGNMMNGTQALNELGKAKVGTEKAHQGAYGAAAGASNRSNQVTAVPHPLDPTKTILVPTNTVYTEFGKNTRGADKNENDLEKERLKKDGKLLPNGEKPINMNAQAMKDIQRIALAMLNDYQSQDDKLRASSATPDGKTGINPNVAVDSALLAKIMGDATALARDPASGFGGNVPGAVQNAMENAIAQGLLKVERTDNQYNPLGDRKVRLSFAGSQPSTTAPSIVSPSQRVENQGSSQPAAQQSAVIPPPAQRIVGKQYQTPKGMLTWAGTGWSQ